jgi:methylmalonyl-CoA mutase C-terminal domain/subunit
MKRPYRVLIAKPGLDGHDRGAHIIARGLRDAGFEVILTGLFQTPEMISRIAVDEDVDAVGLSILSGAHNKLVPRIVDSVERGRPGTLIMVGGVVPKRDVPGLIDCGVRRVFLTGSTLSEIGTWLGNELDSVDEP